VTVTNSAPVVHITTPAAASEHAIGDAVALSATVGDAGANDTLTCSIAWGDGVTTSGTLTGGVCSGSHSYSGASSPTITVTASDDDTATGSDSIGVTITPAPVDQPPTADAGADSSGVEGSPVSLTGSGSDPEGRALTYAWTSVAGAGTDSGASCSFGSPAAASTSFTCDDDGTFAVTLAVSDGVNPAVKDTASISVSNADPTADLTSPTQGSQHQVGAAVAVTAGLTDAGANDTHGCSIDWGDGSTTTGVIASGACGGSHSYAAAATPTITVTVTDDDGGSASDSVGIVIEAAPQNQPPTADAGPNASGAEGSAIALDGTGSDPEGGSLTYAWSYEAGAGVDAGATCTFGSAAAADSTFRCTDDGTYQVTLRVSDGVNAAVADTATVTVGNAVPTVHVTSPATGSQYQAGSAVAVAADLADAGANDTHTCSITWGDGSTAAGAVSGDRCTGSHAYSAASSSRTITVTVTDDDGGSASDSVGVVIKAVPTSNKPPQVSAGPNVKGKEGKTIHLRGKVSDRDGDALTLSWSVGSNGAVQCRIVGPSDEIGLDVVCAPGGRAVATLTASDGVNAPVSDSATITVKAKPANRPPHVSAGGAVKGAPGATIRLNGRAHDRDGDALIKSWSVSGAGGMDCHVVGATDGIDADVTCASAGTAIATLTVSDGVNAPVSDAVRILVQAPQPPEGPCPDPTPAVPAPAAAAPTTAAGRRRA
jgi:hypothetical protein